MLEDLDGLMEWAFLAERDSRLSATRLYGQEAWISHGKAEAYNEIHRELENLWKELRDAKKD